jgi:predicted dehydrogenase
MANGVVYTYRGSWCAEGLKTSWESEWRLVGQNGSVCWDGADAYRCQVVAETGGFNSKWADVEVPAFADGSKTAGHPSVIGEFIRCVREGGMPETICTDNIKSLAMVFGAIESAERGRPVDIKW